MSRAPRPAGLRPSGAAELDERAPERGRVVPRAEDLDAVLAGVAGARDGAAHVRDDRVAEVEDLELARASPRRRRRARATSNAFGPWSAISAVSSVRSSNSQWFSAAFWKTRRHLVAVRRVADDEPAILRGAVDDEVVEDRALLVAGARVERLAVDELRRVVRDRGSSTTCAGVLAAHLELAHVRDVEEAGRRAHGLVLVDDARVLHRHLPAGERDDPRAGFHVLVVEGRLLRGLAHAGEASIGNFMEQEFRNSREIRGVVANDAS